jgi:hypothetical protein
MFSIFDEEEDVEYVRTKPLAPLLETSGRGGISFTITSTLAPFTGPTSPRRRTVKEAVARAREPTSRIKKVGRIPFLRPYAFLFEGLVYGFIVVDPLDRLEGGLID